MSPRTLNFTFNFVDQWKIKKIKFSMIDSKILTLKPYELSSKDISYNLIYKQLESNSLLITVIKSRESYVS